MLVFAAIFLVVTVLESLKSETRAFAARALDDRLYIKVSPDGAERVRELREQVPELRSLAPVNVETHGPFLVRAIDLRLLGTGSLANDVAARREFASEPTIILSTRCADDFGYATGDTVALATPAAGRVDFRVLAVTDEYGFAPDDRVFAAVSTGIMKRYWCLDGEGLGNYFVAWIPGTHPDRLGPIVASVHEILGPENVLSVERGEEIAARYLGDLDRDFAIFHVILVLTVLLATIGVLNAMVIAVLERRREIGLLRAVGLTGGQVARMLLVESGAFGVLGGVLGLVVGIPLATISVRALTELSHLELAFELSPAALGAVLGGALLVALLAVLFPALRANHLRLSAVMRYE
jgi:putative ABC transport system permease protein